MEITLKILLEERHKLLVACNYRVDDDHRYVYESMTDQIAKINRDLFEARLEESIACLLYSR